MVITSLKVSRQDLVALVERSSTLSERLTDRFLPDSEGNDDASIEARLSRWSRTIAGENPSKFEERLGWDGLDRQRVHEVLGNVRLTDPRDLPSWTILLKELLEAGVKKDDAGILDASSPVPFEEIYLPFVQTARQKLLDRVGESWRILSDSVRLQICRQLLQKLHRLITTSLYSEFSLWKALKRSSFSFLIERLQEGESDRYYRAFIEEMHAGKQIAFFRKYSVLARLMAVSIELWIEEKAEFLERLAGDLPLLEATFATSLGSVVSIALDLSEPHNRRRSVSAVTFATGLTLVYKPRGLQLETGYFQLLDWCNRQPGLLPTRSLTVVDRRTHGWMEYVEHLPCTSEDEARRYYERAGMLLCLLYVLHGNDCHEENLIANGEQPVLIDLETLLHPRPRESERESASESIEDRFLDSVLGCGLLPQWEEVGDGGRVEDVSGLGGGDSEIVTRRPLWQNVNTDNLKLAYEIETAPPQRNTLRLDDRTISPGDYTSEIVAGFEKMYRCLWENRDILLAPDGLLAGFADRRVRFLFRPSNVYGQLLMRTVNPKYLQYGIDRSLELEALGRVFLDSSGKPALRPLFDAEIAALERMDVPFFTADSGSDDLHVEGGAVIRHYFQEAGHDRVRQRCQGLNETDLALQLDLIRGSLYSRKASGMTVFTGEHDREEGSDGDLPPLTPAGAIEMATGIALDLQRRGRRNAAGSVNWIGLTYLPKARRYQLQPLDDNLYDGTTGIALFLAALSSVTGENEFRQLSLDVLQTPLERYREIDRPAAVGLARAKGLGGGSGIGSIVYSLVKIARFLDEPSLIVVADRLATGITPETIDLDRSFDPIGGCAGAIFALLALCEVKNDDSLVESAILCGDHLLATRMAGSSGWRAWPVIDEQLTTGFSHGAAGIALALLRLYRASGEERFRSAAIEAIAFEDSLLDPRRENWQDLDSSASFMSSWCHGAPGIGLARSGGLPILDIADIRRDIDLALRTTIATGLPPIDSLCCGNFGRIETLLVASERLPRPDLAELARRQAAFLVARAQRRGHFALTDGVTNSIENPGFFQGTAGIGYQLLRLAAPDRLPSVLLWE